MTLNRSPDWPEKLYAYVQRSLSRPFVWGQHDCVLFALGAAKEMTGVKTVDELRGNYDSALAAIREMRKRYKAKNLTEAANAVQREWGVEEIPVLMAQRGDIVEANTLLPDGSESPSLGVVNLDGQTALFAGPDGLTKIKVKACRRAWRIG